MRLVASVAVALLLTGCSMGSALPDPRLAVTTSAGPLPAPARPDTKPDLTEHSCWTGELLGSDPQLGLQLAATFGISYFDAAYAIKDRPDFRKHQPCAGDHAIEVYRLLPVAEVVPGFTGYSALMQTRGLDFAQLSATVRQACMDRTLTAAARQAEVAGATLQPALPRGFRIDWAPPTPAQWNRGQQVFACLLVQDRPSGLLYAELRTRNVPTALRTCIASGSRIYVDCARKHDRERIAVLDVTAAVLIGAFPKRYQDQGAAFYRPLDRACTTYLHSVSTSRRLSGVAEIDAADWPDTNGAYSVSCEADAPPTKPSVVTQGSVYDR